MRKMAHAGKRSRRHHHHRFGLRVGIAPPSLVRA
jgi:hypothetical protein